MHGMCHSRNRHDDRWREDVDWERERESAPVAVKDRDPGERLTDADRERAAAVLSQAFRDGVLRVEEFDQRLSATYAATSVGDLDEVMRDLPRDWSEELRASEHTARRAERHRREWQAGFQTYRGVMLLLVAIWFFTSLGEFAPGGEEPFFWPIFPILGWGIPLFLSRPRPRRAALAHAGSIRVGGR